MTTHQPMRGSDVEAWLKRHRDDIGPSEYGPLKDLVDWLLDDYREHADTGTPLDREVQGPHGEDS